MSAGSVQSVEIAGFPRRAWEPESESFCILHFAFFILHFAILRLPPSSAHRGPAAAAGNRAAAARIGSCSHRPVGGVAARGVFVAIRAAAVAAVGPDVWAIGRARAGLPAAAAVRGGLVGRASDCAAGDHRRGGRVADCPGGGDVGPLRPRRPAARLPAVSRKQQSIIRHSHVPSSKLRRPRKQSPTAMAVPDLLVGRSVSADGRCKTAVRSGSAPVGAAADRLAGDGDRGGGVAKRAVGAAETGDALRSGRRSGKGDRHLLCRKRARRAASRQKVPVPFSRLAALVERLCSRLGEPGGGRRAASARGPAGTLLALRPAGRPATAA